MRFVLLTAFAICWNAVSGQAPIWLDNDSTLSLGSSVHRELEEQEVDLGGDMYYYNFTTYDRSREAYLSTETMVCIASVLGNNTEDLVAKYIETQTNSTQEWGREVKKVAHRTAERRVILRIKDGEQEWEVWTNGRGNNIVLNPVDGEPPPSRPTPPPGGLGGWVRHLEEKDIGSERFLYDGADVSTEAIVSPRKRRRRRRKRIKRRTWRASYRITNRCRHCPGDNLDDGRRAQARSRGLQSDFATWMNITVTELIKSTCPEAKEKFKTTIFAVLE